MENINNQIFNKIPNYFEPMINNYSSRDIQSYLATGNNQNIQQNILNQENLLSNNLQKQISQHRINNNSLRTNELKRFKTQKIIRRINNNQNSNFAFPEEDDIVLPKKQKCIKIIITGI